MSMQIFSNNAESKLAAAITDIDSTLTVQTGHGAKFQSPTAGQYELITLEDDAGNREIVQCSSRIDDSLTIVRAQEGSVARPWNAGDRISARITANTLARLAQGFDNSGNARGNNAIDLQTTRSGPSEVASGQGAVLIGVNGTAGGVESIVVGSGASSGAEASIVVGKNAAINNGGTNSIAIGTSSGANSPGAIAIGNNAFIDISNDDAVGIGAGVGCNAASSISIGANAYTNAAGACAIGAAASANGVESVALGSGSFANKAGSFAFGNNAFADGAGSLALAANSFAGGEGSIAFCHDASSGGLEAIALGVSSSAAGDFAVAIGKEASAGAANSQALGAKAKARVPGTTVMAGAITLPNTSTFASNPLIELAGAKVVIMSPVINLLAAPADGSIAMPVGARFYIDEIFLLTTVADTVSVQPTVRVGDNTTMDLLLSATETTGLDAQFKRQKFTPSVGNGLSSLSYGVTISATATTLQGRFGFVGILVENE